MNTNLSVGGDGVILAAVVAAAVLAWLQAGAGDRVRDPRALRRAWVSLVAAVVSAWGIGVMVGLLVTGNAMVPGSPFLVFGWVLGLVPAVCWVGYLLLLYRAVTGRSLFDRADP